MRKKYSELFENPPRKHVARGRRRCGRGQARGRDAVGGERGVGVVPVRGRRGGPGHRPGCEGRGHGGGIAEAAVAALAVPGVASRAGVAQVHVVGE